MTESTTNPATVREFDLPFPAAKVIGRHAAMSGDYRNNSNNAWMKAEDVSDSEHSLVITVDFFDAYARQHAKPPQPAPEAEDRGPQVPAPAVFRFDSIDRDSRTRLTCSTFGEVPKTLRVHPGSYGPMLEATDAQVAAWAQWRSAFLQMHIAHIEKLLNVYSGLNALPALPEEIPLALRRAQVMTWLKIDEPWRKWNCEQPALHDRSDDVFATIRRDQYEGLTCQIYFVDLGDSVELQSRAKAKSDDVGKQQIAEMRRRELLHWVLGALESKWPNAFAASHRPKRMTAHQPEAAGASSAITETSVWDIFPEEDQAKARLALYERIKKEAKLSPAMIYLMHLWLVEKLEGKELAERLKRDTTGSVLNDLSAAYKVYPEAKKQGKQKQKR